MADRRFPTSFKDVPDPDEPGLVLGDDNVVYLIKPDGSRVEVGSQTFLVATATLDNAAIKALKTTYYELIPPTEILNYSIEPSELPVPVMATAWLIKHAKNSYGNISTQAFLRLYWGSDLSVLIGQVLEIVGVFGGTDPGGDFRFNNYGGAAFNNTAGSWPLGFEISPQYLNGVNYQDNGIYLAIEDPDLPGDLTGGADTNTLKVEIVYRVVSRA